MSIAARLATVKTQMLVRSVLAVKFVRVGRAVHHA